MSTVIKSIDVDVALSTAFEEWTRFEELPRWMLGVAEVRRLGDRHLYWRAELSGTERQWELEITEIVPERKVAWTSCSGPRNHGAVVLEPLPCGTRVTMQIHYDPLTFVGTVTDLLGLLSRWVDRSLRLFKELMERPDATFGRLPPAEELIGQ